MVRRDMNAHTLFRMAQSIASARTVLNASSHFRSVETRLRARKKLRERDYSSCLKHIVMARVTEDSLDLVDKKDLMSQVQQGFVDLQNAAEKVNKITNLNLEDEINDVYIEAQERILNMLDEYFKAALKGNAEDFYNQVININNENS